MINDKPYLIHVHLLGDKRCYWYAGDRLSMLSDRADCATALDDNDTGTVLIILSLSYGSKLETIVPFKINACPMLDELREARK